jgi:hypothetical protein
MLWFGDFAQLPPVGRTPLYSREVIPSQSAQLTNYEQKQIMSKAIWHQVNTVVILCKNFRSQSPTSEEDGRFRAALY